MRRALIAALVTLCACSSSGTDANNDGIADGTYNPNDVTVIAPSQPKGNLAGLVLDADGAPVAGASVSTNLSTTPATTDSNGHFSFTNLPAGSAAGITITKGGFTTAYAQATIPSAAGNVPIDGATAYVGPVRLFATTASLNVSVVGYDGQPLSPKASLQISPAFAIEGQTGTTFGGWTVVDATGSNGVITFSGVPDLGQLARLAGNQAVLSLAVEPVDTNADGTFEYGGATLSIRASDALSSPGQLAVVLPPPSQAAGSLEVSASSCNTMVTAGSGGGGGPVGSVINAGDKIFVAFNQPVIESSVTAQITDDDGTPIDTGAPVFSSSDTVLNLAGNFPPGHAISVTLTATPAASRPATTRTFGGTCFVAPTSSAPTVTSVSYAGPDGGFLQPGEAVHIELDSAVGTASGSPVLSAYLDADTDGDGKHESLGEQPLAGSTNDSAGFTVFPDPAKPTSFSGRFSRFFVFSYNPASNPQAVPPQRSLTLYFDDSRTPGTTADLWVNGTPFEAGTAISGVIRPDGT